MKRALALVLTSVVAGCDWLSDPATRLDSELEAAANHLGESEGARYTFVRPGRGQCPGAYRVQINKGSALVVWCLDMTGHATASGLTTHHNTAMDTAADYLIDVSADRTLRVDFERRGGRAVIVGLGQARPAE